LLYDGWGQWEGEKVANPGDTYTGYGIYGLSNPSASGTITNVNVTFNAIVTNSGSATGLSNHAWCGLYIGSTAYYGSSNTITTSQSSPTYDWDANPAGGSWSWSAIDDISLVIKADAYYASGSGTVETRIAYARITITYTPSESYERSLTASLAENPIVHRGGKGVYSIEASSSKNIFLPIQKKSAHYNRDSRYWRSRW
jgi:hypothetical protein